MRHERPGPEICTPKGVHASFSFAQAAQLAVGTVLFAITVVLLGRCWADRRNRRAGRLGAPGVFGMASEERTRALLDGAGFRSVRTAEVPVHFGFRSLEDYEQ